MLKDNTMTGQNAAKRAEIIRYDLERCDGESGRCRAEVGPCIGGDWVLYADYVTQRDAAVAEARREERERCAKLAEEYDYYGPSVGDEIADLIRSGPPASAPEGEGK